MKIPVFTLDGRKKSEIAITRLFREPVRGDAIRRVFRSEQAFSRQTYGTDPLAGQRSSAHYHGRRGVRTSMMNRELARMKRIHSSGHLYMRARTVPQAVKGRKAHPPKTEKKWEQKVNKKERFKALLSSLSASNEKKFLEKRGHMVDELKHLPLVFEDKLESVKSPRELLKILSKTGLEKEIDRLRKKKARPGKGTMRGRKFKRKKGPLLIVNEDKGLSLGCRNIPGLEMTETSSLPINLLAPGACPGRVIIWSESALKKMEEMVQ